MSHLTPELIERYLDGDLASAERAAAVAHLGACAACRADLALMRALGAELAALPDEPPPIDLAPLVLTRIAAQSIQQGAGAGGRPSASERTMGLPAEPFPRPRWGVRAWALLAAQTALCLILGFWLAPQLLAQAGPALGGLGAGLTAAPMAVAGWAADLAGWWQSITAGLAALDPGRGLALVSPQWTLLLGVAALIWLAGNSYLLAGLHERPARTTEVR